MDTRLHAKTLKRDEVTLINVQFLVNRYKLSVTKYCHGRVVEEKVFWVWLEMNHLLHHCYNCMLIMADMQKLQIYCSSTSSP